MTPVRCFVIIVAKHQSVLANHLKNKYIKCLKKYPLFSLFVA